MTSEADRQYKADSEKPPKKWTVMVFMGAGRGDGNDASLDEFARADIDEMLKVRPQDPESHLNIFIELHGLSDGSAPTRQWIGHTSAKPVPPSKRDALDGTVLTDFIEWALTTGDHGPDDHSLLILWGHAYDFAIGHQLTRSGIDALDFGELAQVLTQLQAKVRALYEWPADRMPRIDILGFDACDLATIEIANHLEPFANYLIASQIGIPLPGWPYDTILTRLKRSATVAPMTPAQFGAFAVRKFCEEYDAPGPNGRPLAVSLTLLDLQKAPEAFIAAEQLAQCLAAAAGQDDGELSAMLTQFRQSQTMEDKPFVDVADLCLNLSRAMTDVDVRIVASELGDILIRPRFGESERGSFILEHGRNSHETAKLQGVSMYAPQLVADRQDWRASRFWYNKFSFSGETLWSRLVHVLAEGH